MMKQSGVSWLRVAFPLLLCAALGVSAEVRAESVAWFVELIPGTSPGAVAEAVEAESWSPVGRLDDAYLFTFRGEAQDLGARLATHPAIIWEEERVERVYHPRVSTADEPLFADQWHLENRQQWGGLVDVDVGATGAWADDLDGSGIGVAVVDSGVQYTHPEFAANYIDGYDYIEENRTPLPDDDTWTGGFGTSDDHGTAVAGIIAAADNGQFGLGIAPAASLYAYRIPLGENGGFGSDLVADVFASFPDDIAVFNNSWGPGDSDGVALSSVNLITRNVLADGARNNRGGLGSIFVWAAGNGRLDGQRAVYDGYNASPFTITVGAIGQDGQVASYSEGGSNVLVVAPSFGAGRAITTTDRTGFNGYANGSMTDTFSGTSAAAPMVSGVVALMLEANPQLGWRDVQHILARTAVRTAHEDPGWFENDAGFWLHDDYGFGRVDAIGATRLARRWTPLPDPEAPLTQNNPNGGDIPDQSTLSRSLTVTEDRRVEHVEVTVNLTHAQWRQLEIVLVSPAGTRSVLASPFTNAQLSSFNEWTYLTLGFWGERAAGTWRLEVRDTVEGTTGRLDSVGLRIHGTAHAVGSAPAQADKERLARNTWPYPLVAEEWLTPDGPAPLEILAAKALDRGTVWQDAAGQWWFQPPTGDYGVFPLGLTVAGEGAAVRHYVVSLERPAVLTDGNLSPTVDGLEEDLSVVRSPFLGALALANGGFQYLPDPPSVDAPGSDRFSLATAAGELSLPAFFAQDWTMAFDGRESAVALDFGLQALTGRF
ncbi:MAG: S8 family peptidase, partial [Opitutales bacterium]